MSRKYSNFYYNIFKKSEFEQNLRAVDDFRRLLPLRASLDKKKKYSKLWD